MTAATVEDDTASLESDSDCDGEPPRAFEAQSYSDLLKFPEIPVSPKTIPAVDAIIVPTIRSAEHLNSAVDLAANAGCKLVTLYTEDFPAGLPAVHDRLGAEAAILLALPRRPAHGLLKMAADLQNNPVSECALDISMKRNLGLLIGRLCGWTRVLFLDDDVRRLNVEKLGSAAGLLTDYPVVGLQVRKFPDASVVGHARRLAGRRQEPFISGGALLADPQRLNGFFAPVYHEDWICVLNHLRRGQVAVGGEVGQLPYRPFTTPERARLEEFGDILASGLLCLIRQRGTAPADDRDYWQAATDPLFWKQVLGERAQVLEELVTRLERLSLPDPSPMPSVQAARRRCYELTPEELTWFTGRWLSALAAWRERLAGLPRVGTIGEALARLGLSHTVRAYGPAAAARAPWPRRLGWRSS